MLVSFLKKEREKFNECRLFYLFDRFLIITVVSSTALLFWMLFSSASRSDQIVDMIDTDYGIVQKVYQCKRSKYSMRCTVVTDKYRFTNIDVTDFPGDDMLYQGDRIGVRKYEYEDRITTYWTRNGYAKSHSVCYDWAPCFKPLRTPDNQ